MSVAFARPFSAAVFSVALLVVPTVAAAATVASGFDLLQTVAGTHMPFMGSTIEMQGAPWLITSPGCGAAQFDFNDGAGCRKTFNTSAILHRLGDATVSGTPGSAGVEVEFVALALISKLPVLGGDYLAVRLLKDLVTGTWLFGENLISSADIRFDSDAGGTFTTSLSFGYAAVAAGDPGTVLATNTLQMTQAPNIWGRNAPPFALRIPSVNEDVSGNNDSDFWSGSTPLHEFPPEPTVHCDSFPDCGHRHVTTPATVPVPAAGPLLGGALAAFWGLVGWRRRLRG